MTRVAPVFCIATLVLGCSSSDFPFEEVCSGSSSSPPNIGAWDSMAASFEQRVLELTNERRLQGGCCGSEGCFDPAPALAHNDNLEAAARLHAKDMVEQSYFSHDSLDGRTLSDRVDDAGFAGCAIGENIAQGHETPDAVVEGWMASDGHCANILTSTFGRLGVGYFEDPDGSTQQVWVQNFGD